MASPNEKLAESLSVLKALQKGGRRVFRSRQLSRVHRERLVSSGFLLEVMKGWLVSASPSAREGDSTPWYASFWEFCARYCNERFGDEWYLSPEQSLLIHGEKTVIPEQVVVYSPKGTNNNVKLLFGTSLYDLRQPAMPPASDLVARDGLRLFSRAAALVRAPESFFSRNSVEAHVVLAGLADTADLLRRLLDGGHTAKAGLLAAAFRRTNRPELAEEIINAMRAAGYDVREGDSLATAPAIGESRRVGGPLVERVQVMWESMRDDIVRTFSKAPGLPKNRRAYLHRVDEIYESDAYHSLSIEGYSVTPPLIERVRKGDWDPERHEEDRRSRDAMAARGYWQAFQSVKGTVEKVVSGADPGALVRAAHKEWYRELFQPCVAAGLIPAGALAGYLRTSRYVPPRWEVVREVMPVLFDLLENESEPAVRAVLGHWLFGYIHPYPDGNGRIARFLMNVMLASGGYAWTVIRVEDRKEYLGALDSASIDMDIKPFSAFVAERTRWPLEHVKRS